MGEESTVVFDQARTAIAVCGAVDSGDVESFAKLVSDFDRLQWVHLAEQALSLLRECIHEIAALSGRPIGAVYEERFGRLVWEEASGMPPENLVLACLRNHFTGG
jgi:hypothetical protein